MSLNISNFKKFADYAPIYIPKSIVTKDEANVWAQDSNNAKIVREFQQNVDDLAKENYVSNAVKDNELLKVNKKDNGLVRMGKNVINSSANFATDLYYNAPKALKYVSPFGVIASKVMQWNKPDSHAKVQQMMKEHPELRYFSSGLNAYKGYYDPNTMARNAAQDANNLKNEIDNNALSAGLTAAATAATLPVGGAGGLVARGGSLAASRIAARTGSKGLGKTVDWVSRNLLEPGIQYSVNPMAAVGGVAKSLVPGGARSLSSRAVEGALGASILPWGNNSVDNAYKTDFNFKTFLKNNPEFANLSDDDQRRLYQYFQDFGFVNYIRNNPELLKRIENTPEQDRAKLLNELRANYKGGIPNIKEHAAEYNEWRNALLNANR